MDRIEWGLVANTHGVRGELKVMPWVDFLGLYKKIKTIDIDGASYKILSARGHKQAVLLTLEGVDSMEKAQALKNKVLTTPREAIDLGQGHYFYSDIYGFEVYDERTEAIIGTLDRVEEYPAGDIYVVKSPTGEIMIPINDAFDRGVELDKKRVLVCTIEGMLDNED